MSYSMVKPNADRLGQGLCVMHFQKDAAEKGALHGLVFWRVRAVGRLWDKKGNASTSGADWQTQKFPLKCPGN